MRDAIPSFAAPFAILLCILNFLFPGLGRYTFEIDYAKCKIAYIDQVFYYVEIDRTKWRTLAVIVSAEVNKVHSHWTLRIAI